MVNSVVSASFRRTRSFDDFDDDDDDDDDDGAEGVEGVEGDVIGTDVDGSDDARGGGGKGLGRSPSLRSPMRVGRRRTVPSIPSPEEE